jgi:hypothetical protein
MRRNYKIISLILIGFIMYQIKNSIKLNRFNKLISKIYEPEYLFGTQFTHSNQEMTTMDDGKKRQLPGAIIIGGEIRIRFIMSIIGF